MNNRLSKESASHAESIEAWRLPSLSFEKLGMSARFVLLCMLLFLSIQTQAQQTPLFSAYYFNKILINPAFTGIDNQYRAYGVFRSQWADMPGRPITGGVTVEGSFWKNRIGAGVFVVNDRIGIFNQTNVSASYAQKIKFAEHHQIAIGLQGSALINQIDFSNTLAKDFDDPSIAEQERTKTAFDLNAGISYQWKNLLLGFCVPQVLQSNAEFGSVSTYTYVRHYNALAQYKVSLLEERFNITPSLLLRKGAASDFQVDATLLLDYKNKVFAGAGYRSSFGVIAMAGLKVFDMLTVAYAYDFTTEKTLNGHVGNTHEIVFGVHLPSDYKKNKQQQNVVTEPILTDSILYNLQRANDTLARELKYAQQELDSLSKVLQSIANNPKQAEPVEPDSVKAVIDKLFKSQPAGDHDKTKPAAYRLDKIYFDRNSDALTAASNEQLDALVSFLKQFPEVEIMINGYADNTGSVQLNKELSEHRAQAVAAYLIKQGISKNRLTHKGYGKENPIGDNSTAEGRRMNRRVEFTITKQ